MVEAKHLGNGWYGVTFSPDGHPPNVSEADFVKWQSERQRDKDAIKALTDMVCALQEDVRYWQQAAMSHVVR